MQPGIRSQIQLFVHWLVAHMAAAGGFTALFAGLDSVVDPPLYLQLLCLGLGLLAVLLLFKAQELILRQAHLPAPYWVLQSVGAVLLGGLGGLLAYGCLYLINDLVLPFETRLLLSIPILLLVLLAPGMLFGWFQGSGVFPSRREHLAWTFLHGLILLPVIIVAGIIEAIFDIRSSLTIGAVLGLSYGVLTGSCLLWLVPTTERNRHA